MQKIDNANTELITSHADALSSRSRVLSGGEKNL